jgi:hypothetical protein
VCRRGQSGATHTSDTLRLMPSQPILPHSATFFRPKSAPPRCLTQFAGLGIMWSTFVRLYSFREAR